MSGKAGGTAAECGVVYVVFAEVVVGNACEGACGSEAYAFVVEVLEKGIGVAGDLEAVKDPFGAATDIFGDAVDAVGVLLDESAQLFRFFDWREVCPRRVFQHSQPAGFVVVRGY